MAGISSELLQQLLEQAVRESLRQVARSAVEPEMDGSLQSISSVVHSVSARVIEQAGHRLPSLECRMSGKTGHNPGQALVEPLLDDLAATPWLVWREPSPPARERPHASVQEPGRSPITPEVARRSEESVFTSTTTSSRHCMPEDDAIPEDSSRGEAARCNGLHLPGQGGTLLRPLDVHRRSMSFLAWPDPQVFDYDAAHQSISSICSPMHAFKPGPLILDSLTGETPLVVRRGLTIEANNAQHLMMQWQGRPRAVLMVAKRGDHLVLATLQDMAAWLSSQGIVVVVEPQLLADQPQLRSMLHSARTFSASDRLEQCIDLVITIGGDGTLTWAVSLFRGPMPPVLSFAAGSLGFLTPFPLDGWVRTLTQLLDLHRARVPVPLVCRMRLQVVVRRRSGALNVLTSDGSGCTEDHTIQVQCLNEVLVHRGQSGALAKLDVGVDGERVTLVQGDGLILATPTGSTAYSLAAGGSMVHPAVPAILLTPVSPHSLSFRPALLPDSAIVTVGVPLNARHGAALSVDGKDICAVRVGDSVEVAMSPYPVPTICRTTETGDWFASVHEALQWNGRAEQK